MDGSKSQNEAEDRIWPVLEPAARGLLQSKGCTPEEIGKILADMRPRCSGMPAFSSSAKPASVPASPRPLDLKKFAEDQGKRLVADVNDFVDSLVGWSVQRIVDLEIELHAEKAKEN